MSITTYRPLTLGSSSVFDPLAFDIKAGENRNGGTTSYGGLLTSRGKVLGYDTFDDGSFCGWNPMHFHFATSTVAPGLTNDAYMPAYRGRNALLLSPADPDLPGSSCGTYKRYSKYREDGVVSFSGMFAVAGDGSMTTMTLPFADWGISIDTQRWDNSSRAFYQVAYRDDGTGNVKGPAWYAMGAGGWQVINGTRGVTAGLNERKSNYNYVRMTVDMGANGGAGGYVELQVNDFVFNLRTAGLGTPADVTYKETSWDWFSGGLNTGIGISRSSINAANKVSLVADELLFTVNDMVLAA